MRDLLDERSAWWETIQRFRQSRNKQTNERTNKQPNKQNKTKQNRLPFLVSMLINLWKGPPLDDSIFANLFCFCFLFFWMVSKEGFHCTTTTAAAVALQSVLRLCSVRGVLRQNVLISLYEFDLTTAVTAAATDNGDGVFCFFKWGWC